MSRRLRKLDNALCRFTGEAFGTDKIGKNKFKQYSGSKQFDRDRGKLKPYAEAGKGIKL